MNLHLAAVEQFVTARHPVRHMHRVRALTISHHTADLETRARFALSAEEQAAFYERLQARCERLQADGLLHNGEAVILATCNRSELYVTACGGSDHDEQKAGHASCDASDLLAAEAVQIWADLRQLPSHELSYLHTLYGPTAVQHLLEVACGLQSAVLGETQILQQLKGAYRVAYAHGAAGSVLYPFFHAAFRAGRRARAETAIGEGNVSVASVGVEMARQRAGGSLASQAVLLVGAGTIGRLTVEHLLAAGVRDLRLANRTVANLAPLAETARRLGVEPQVVPLAEATAHVAAADVLLTAIGGDEPYFTKQRLAPAMAGRANRPLIAVDLGVPPNVEPALAMLPGVCRVGIDDLQACADSSLERRQAEVPKVRRIIGQEWRRMEDASDAATQGAVAALFRAFQQHNLAEAARQGKYGLPASDEELIAYGQRLIRRVLKPLVERLSQSPADTPERLHLLKQVADLFGLHPADVDAD